MSDEMLDKLSTLSTQSLIDGLWVMGWPSSFIEGARPLAKGQKCAGRAVTLRFVPHRPDVAADKPVGVESPEYEAFEKCGPREVLVMSSVGPWESVGGDIKFLRLKQLNVGGLVTDGSVRDTDEILSYGFPVFSFSTTAKQGPAIMQPWECNGVIECGKVVVRPGDAIVGDQDGVVVVPAAAAQQVYDIAHGREEIEGIIKEELVKNPGPPGKYYPFKPPIKPESPLGQLLTSKGVKFHSTWAGRTSGSRRSLSSGPGLAGDPYMRSSEDMARVLKRFSEYRACAVLRTPTADLAPPAMEAAIKGGFEMVEFTLTTPGCLDLVADFRGRYDNKVRSRARRERTAFPGSPASLVVPGRSWWAAAPSSMWMTPRRRSTPVPSSSSPPSSCRRWSPGARCATSSCSLVRRRRARPSQPTRRVRPSRRSFPALPTATCGSRPCQLPFPSSTSTPRPALTWITPVIS